MEFEYLAQPPRRYTFEMKELKSWVEKYCVGRTLNLFGVKVRLMVNEISNDIDTDMPTDYHLDAFEFCKKCKKGIFDTVILDPPYNFRKAMENYGGRYMTDYPIIMDKVMEITTQNARVITLGYNTGGMGKVRGFEKIALCVVNHGAGHNDTLCLVEQKVRTMLVEGEFANYVEKNNFR